MLIAFNDNVFKNFVAENLNGNSKGSYSVKTNNSGGTPGGASRVHKIDSLTPYQNRYNKKNISKKQNISIYCNYDTTTYVTCYM